MESSFFWEGYQYLISLGIVASHQYIGTNSSQPRLLVKGTQCVIYIFDGLLPVHVDESGKQRTQNYFCSCQAGSLKTETQLLSAPSQLLVIMLCAFDERRGTSLHCAVYFLVVGGVQICIGTTQFLSFVYFCQVS